MRADPSCCLTTNAALDRLHNDIESVLKEKDWSGGWDSWLRDCLDPKCAYSTLSLPSAVFLLTSGTFLIILSASGGDSAPSVFDGIFILLLLALSLATVFWDSRLRRQEVLRRTNLLVESISRLKKEVHWTSDNYPSLTSPVSPCITLQWTWRDGEIVNLPWALLVRGDVIVMRPGHAAPGFCVPLEDTNGPPLHAKEVYNPLTPHEGLSLPAARAPLEDKNYVLQETPYVRNLRTVLEQSLQRPVSYHDKERHLIFTRCVEHVAFPTVVLLLLLMNIIRHFLLKDSFGSGHWSDAMILQPICAGLPLLPLTLPVAWRLISAWGVTKLRAVLQDTAPCQVVLDPFEDLDVEASALHCGELWKFYKDDLLGRSTILSRSTNVLHVLGSVTALCCVDKKGVLSWPNPNAEKVFFLRQSGDISNSRESIASEGYCEPQRRNLAPDDLMDRDPLRTESTSDGVAEVLDLTHDHVSPFRLQFDDQSWKQHLTNLKPLGLAILLNTCNSESQEIYSQFCCHLSCEASLNESLVPVTNRRCLCELAAEIGFTEQAQDAFTLEQVLCTFQHVRPETVKRDIKFAKQLSMTTKLKFPFPHMVDTVLRDKQTGCLQLMSQGTADVILDSCVEYWDGYDLHPLTPADRKKILDFYQRTSLTANCTAFAYRPLSKSVSPKLSQVYLEIPSDSRHLYLPYRSPTPLALSLLDAKWRGVLAQFHSSDSLLGTDGKEEEVSDMEGWFELQSNQVFVGMVTMQYQAQADVVLLVEQLERACIRFVHFSKENELRSRVFSEKMGLESGWNCHISLHSDRTRSEEGQSAPGSRADLSPAPCVVCPKKTSHMELRGTELQVQQLNERTNLTASRAMSFSAPSAINTDMVTVKFDEQALNWSEGPLQGTTAFSHRERRISQDSVVLQSMEGEQWRSLSCLTDSTDQSVPFAFDISNRAKLPRGIDKIRPHLELIDNVPLLVSLFTDCTPTVTREMLHIMQDYGEVVVVFGSSANYENTGVFLQADASIAVEPLYPQVCQKLPVFSMPTPTSGPSPVELSRVLNSLPCTVSIRREDPLSLFHLITCARDFCLSLRNFLQFWLCCLTSVSIFLVVSALVLLPPPLTSGHILVICCIVVPLLSSSLMALPTDPQVMHKATGKNQCLINVEVLLFILWCYGLKCVPSVIVLLSLYGSGLSFYCHAISLHINSTCSFVYPSVASDLESAAPTYWGGWSQFSYTFLFLQHCSALLFVLHLVAASCSYVHRDKALWRGPPFSHTAWVVVAVAAPVIQIIYSAISLFVTRVKDSSSALQGVSMPWWLILCGLLSPFLVLVLNEGVKWQEMKENKRFLRRKRLDFGTKLGMNSPF